VWHGSALLGPGRLVCAGRPGVMWRRQHACVTLVLATSGLLLVADGRGRRRAVGAAVIPSGAPHRIRGLLAGCVTAYLDPDGTAGSHLSGRLAALDTDALSVRTWADAAGPVSGLGRRESWTDPAVMVDLALRELAVPPPATRRLTPAGDARRAVELLPDLLGGPVWLAELAARLGLPAKELGDLFREELHLAFPAYVRWLRLGRAMERLRDGGRPNDAARVAGFADAGHLACVTHRMFGAPPVALAGRLREPHHGGLSITARRPR
jgi:AraC-like DNA-binding protein